MLNIVIPSVELWDEKNEQFIHTKERKLQLEHSLVSVAKWEAKWNKPFINKKEKTTAEIIDYVRCMTITQNVPDSLSGSLDIANRTGSRINEVRSKTTDNSSVLDKISDAVGNFNGGNSFENTFNITGSNPKEIAEEVSNIIQRQVERRDASWA
jgi:hypothetical protein